MITMCETVVTVRHVCDCDNQMWTTCENKVGQSVSSTICDGRNTLHLTAFVSLLCEAIICEARCFDAAAMVRFHKEVYSSSFKYSISCRLFTNTRQLPSFYLQQSHQFCESLASFSVYYEPAGLVYGSLASFSVHREPAGLVYESLASFSVYRKPADWRMRVWHLSRSIASQRTGVWEFGIFLGLSQASGLAYESLASFSVYHKPADWRMRVWHLSRSITSQRTGVWGFGIFLGLSQASRLVLNVMQWCYDIAAKGFEPQDCI